MAHMGVLKSLRDGLYRDIGLRVKFRVCSLGREFPSVHYICMMGP